MSTPPATASSVIAPPKTKMVNVAMIRVVCRMASESLMPAWPQYELAALSSGERPPQSSEKSLEANDTDASAKATPPRRPENHIMNMYVAEILGSSPAAGVSERKQLVIQEPT